MNLSFSYETTSTTMQFCLFELSQNKEIQQKARDEVKKVLSKHGELSYEALSDMKYVEQCIEGCQGRQQNW
jgi:cytochrome P450 family 6